MSHPVGRQVLSLLAVWTMLTSGPGAADLHALPDDSAVSKGGVVSYGLPLPELKPSPVLALTPAPSPSATASDAGYLRCASAADANSLLPLEPSPGNKQVDEWGSITVAQPKIWQFERVSALLDGLLRDVEGISLADLTQLDPNAQNAAALKFVQSALEVGVQYDQAAAVTNGINRDNFKLQQQAQQKRFEADNAYVDLLVQQRNAQTAQLLAAQSTVNNLQPLADAKTITSEQVEQLGIASARVSTLTSSLGTINDSIGKASISSLAAAPTLQNTTVQGPASGSDMSSTLSGYADVLKNLPDGVTKNLNGAFQSPTLPATKRLDNFITLLYERLAREVSVLQDDLTRSPDNVAYLLQFDVGVYPSRKANSHDARVEFEINCPDCKVYSLYPGQSSYNLGNFSGSTKRTTLWGNVLTLLGFGASASYRRQTDMLQGSLVQSVYAAGFQEGVSKEGSAESRNAMPDGSRAVQRFGWYYGAAPFEKGVSPGIRSTFAVVTVPRASIDGARDIFGNSAACMPLHIISAWAKRDDPMRQHKSASYVGKLGRGGEYPFYKWNDKHLFAEAKVDSHDGDSVERLVTSVKLPGAPEEASIVAKRERDTLHVLRMEYNTVFADTADTTTPAAPAIAMTSTASTTSTAAATATSTAATTSVSLDPLAPCPPKKCAGVLLRLDRPVDPNLVITVRGEPLKRVRDWRGRATSILPATQSGTDLTTQAVSNGTLGSTLIKQLQNSRSLLETDQAEPNSWFALNSNELFLNISVDLASDDEFPVIQLTDSTRTVLIPHDLRKGTTDLIINGLHMQTQSKEKIEQDFLRSYASENAIAAFRSSSRARDNAPITAGPYPFTTYTPLFLADATPQRIYARLGESRDDLLVGFLPPEAAAPAMHWSEGHTQVIVEDRDLDYAWALSCFVQGDELACQLPRPAIQQVYQAYLNICPQNAFCPGAKESATVLQTAFKLSQPAKKPLQEVLPSDPAETAIQKMSATIKAAANTIATPKEFASVVNNAPVSSLQVWVIQSDVDGNQVFYSAEPARIDFFPLTDDYWDEKKGFFKSWHFAGADTDSVRIQGCNYFPSDSATTKHWARLLGSSLSPTPKELSVDAQDEPDQAIRSGQTSSQLPTGCAHFNVDTRALTKNQVVFRLIGGKSSYVAPLSIPTYRLAPKFSDPVITAVFPKGEKDGAGARFQPTSWILDFDVSRTICSDTIETQGGKAAGFTPTWLIGENEAKNCTAAEAQATTNTPFITWQSADDDGRVHLRLTVDRSAFPLLEQEIRLVRHGKGGEYVLARLPNLKKLLFPTKLSLETLSATQFALRGNNAQVIAAVALQNGSTARTFPAASGVDYSIVTLPAAKPTTNDTESKTAQNGETLNKASITRDKNSLHIDVTESSKNPTAKVPAPDAKNTKNKGNNNDNNDKNSESGSDASKDKNTGQEPLTAGTYSVIALFQVGEHTNTSVKPSKTIPDYEPIVVRDVQGKPLVFTVADTKKTAKTDTTTTPAMCAVACQTQPCTVPCPKPAAGTTTP